MPSGRNIDKHTDGDECCAKPERWAVRLNRESALNCLDFLQEDPEARHHESESHQGQACPNPGQHGTFRGQVVSQASFGTRFGARTHCLPPVETLSTRLARLA